VTIFDLLFLLVAFASVGCLLTCAVVAISGNHSRALRLLEFWGMGAAIYLMAILVVSFTEPQRVLRVGQLRCWDDWCLTVEKVERSSENGSARYDVALRISSRALRVNQRARDAAVFLTDDRGNRYAPQPDDSAIPLNFLLHPGESIPTQRTFTVPEDAAHIGLIADHGSGPANFVIGDEHSFFHKRTIVKFP
jgi:hypothetical protein